ncbi:MAG: hypothetical protein EBU90_09585 [Proteobacteria bacterium]|nr:hypothetical protein [Pseudomonadota bacterium]NBP14386.1 hypothetical protein [bacterium]
MNKKFVLLVMCVSTFSVYAAYDSYVVVDLEPDTVYREEDDSKIDYKVRDKRGTELSVSFFKKDRKYCSKVSRYDFPVCVKGRRLNPFPTKEAFQVLERLWLQQEKEKPEEADGWCIV